MKSDDYKDMKSRLREVLQQWGLWTDGELEVVARFVEQEVASGAFRTTGKVITQKRRARR